MFNAETAKQPNHYMLQLAREARELTQKDLCERMNITQATLSKYENGLHPAPLDFLEVAGNAMNFPISFFFEPGIPYGLPPFHFRRRKKLGKKALGRIIAEMNIRRMHIQKLMRSYEHHISKPIPEIDRDEYRGTSNQPFSIEDVAASVRGHFMLPRGPINNIVDLIESSGGIVVECDFGTDLLDAMSQRIDGSPVLFFVNKNIPGDRLRRTLCHELGHMILHTTIVKEDDDMECEADNFAGAFLLPAEEIAHYIKRLDLRNLANLKLHWRVAMSALAVRADRLKLVSEYEKKKFWMEYSQLGYRRREPVPVEREKPTLLNKIIGYHMKELGYTTQNMADLLHMKIHDFSKTYLDQTYLKIVS